LYGKDRAQKEREVINILQKGLRHSPGDYSMS